MDLSKFDLSGASEQGAFLHLSFAGEKLYTEGKEPVGLRLYGPESRRYKDAERRVKKERMDRVRVGRGGRVRGLGDTTMDERELLAAVVYEYVNIEVDGETLPAGATKDQTLALFERFGWIEDQVADLIDDDNAWLGESSTN